jgi:hypothetical protein
MLFSMKRPSATNTIGREVNKLLRRRDRAVRENDLDAFLATQISEIPGSSAAGYVAVDRLVSRLKATYQDRRNRRHVMALIHEEYWRNGAKSHDGYLLYHLLRQPDGELKISAIAWTAHGGGHRPLKAGRTKVAKQTAA